jgi:ABC-2 type transport system permease protein
VSFENVDLMDLFSFLPSLLFLGGLLYYLNFSLGWPQILIYIILIINALIFLYAIHLMVATMSFWTTQSYGVGRILDNIFKISRYPLDIFEGWGRFFFIYIFPLIVIAQLPTQALLGKSSWDYILWGLIVSLSFLVVALKFWKKGLRNYLSASS